MDITHTKGVKDESKKHGNIHIRLLSPPRETFKGVNEALKGKIFIIGPDQASRYDDVLKSLIGYLSSKYDHRVSLCTQHKDKSVGVQLLTRPTAPLKPDPNNASREVLDKDGEEWVIYHIRLKNTLIG